MTDEKLASENTKKDPPRKKRPFYSPDLGRSVMAHSNKEAKEIVNEKLKKLKK